MSVAEVQGSVKVGLTVSAAADEADGAPPRARCPGRGAADLELLCDAPACGRASLLLRRLLLRPL